MTKPSSKPSHSSGKSSIRHSLGLAGKALVDVINKDDKNAKSSRRLSAALMSPSLPTPDSKTLTRSRASFGISRPSIGDHPPSTSTNKILRPRTANSALPKYRPKSVIESANAPSPSPTTGTRRRLSSSEDDEKEHKPARVKSPVVEKGTRPISPMPQRAALKVNLSKINTTPTKQKPLPKSTSARPTKFAKTTNAGSISASALPRPSSSTSSSSSPVRTPKTPISNRTTGIRHPSAASPHSLRTESPLARHSRQHSKSGGGSPNAKHTNVGNMSHISEGHSEDSDADDVELMLAPVASLAAPTPAMPRIHSTHARKRLPPRTPTRADFLPSRANLSYLSPLPPDKDSPSSSSLRPSQLQSNGKQARGSILSWEQLASEASKTLGEDEIETMLSDFPPPFRPGAISPTPSNSQLEVPESPCLSVLSSPGGYGSISQVLLPDVTPSPATNVHNSSRYDATLEISAVDAAVVTLLRLQLAAAESKAKERLLQMQSMEEEIHNLKQSRNTETQELVKQVVYMEEQLRGSLETRERTKEELTVYTTGLEDELRRAQALHDQAVKEAVIRGQEMGRASLDAALCSQRESSERVCSARVAICEWASVRGLAEMELDVVREERSVLALLLTELDQLIIQ